MFEKKPGDKAGPKEKSLSAGSPDAVRLKPVLGIRPGVYLTVLYALILGGVLFFVLAYPGLSKPGSLVAFRSEPSGAAVRVDGVTLGSTPFEHHLPRGGREIEMVLPGFAPRRIELNIRGRIFGSLFFPRRETVMETLEAVNPLQPLLLGAADYARWSLAGEPGAAYQVPQSLSEGAYRAGPAAADPETRAAMDETLREALGFAITRAALRDLLRAKFLIDNGGLAPSPVSLAFSLTDMAALLAGLPGSAEWLAGLLPGEAAGLIGDSPRREREAPSAAGPFPGSPGSLEVDILVFREIPGGVLSTGGTFPQRIEIPAFRIALTEVSSRAWERFLDAEPGWGRENLETLTAQGQVSPDYLAPWAAGGGFPEEAGFGVSAVSWYAAEAYCRWLTGRLPPDMGDFEARLPTEAEWEYAAKLILQSPNAPGMPELIIGGNWEWCGNSFAPLPLFLSTGTRFVSSPERPLKGGAWINPPDSVNAETRASLPPETCSPFVSFRPIIAPRRLP
jgi:hypothetical protein